MRSLSIVLLSATIFTFGVVSVVSQERVVYEIDRANYAEWYLYGMNCNQVDTIRLHVTPQWAPLVDLSCWEAFGLQGDKRLGVQPDQWVEIKLRSRENWALLEELDRR